MRCTRCSQEIGVLITSEFRLVLPGSPTLIMRLQGDRYRVIATTNEQDDRCRSSAAAECHLKVLYSGDLLSIHFENEIASAYPALISWATFFYINHDYHLPIGYAKVFGRMGR